MRSRVNNISSAKQLEKQVQKKNSYSHFETKSNQSSERKKQFKFCLTSIKYRNRLQSGNKENEFHILPALRQSIAVRFFTLFKNSLLRSYYVGFFFKTIIINGFVKIGKRK
jgi:predicted nucleotidyltransferase component of viral defense system